jgi:hypothetical protein
MPDPRRTARRGIGYLAAMGVQWPVAAEIVTSAATSAALAADDAGAADTTWLKMVSVEAAIAADESPSRAPTTLRAATEQLTRRMDGLGYGWSAELGRFMPRESESDFHDRCPRCPVCGLHRHGGDCSDQT